MKKSIIVTCLIAAAITFLAFRSDKKESSASQYTIVSGITINKLQTEVTTNLNLGWELLGGVSYAEGRYIQAMSR